MFTTWLTNDKKKTQLGLRDDETIKYQFKMILFPPKSRYFKSNIPDIIFKISCFRQKNNSPKIDTLSFHRP
jgi:hypothetical protein